MNDRQHRVGDLAKRTGITVRTLHHWDQIGLLSPSGRTASGHRLYGPDAIQRLQRIRSLKALGLGLREIGQALASGGSTLSQVLQAHRNQVGDQLRMLKSLESRLESALNLLRDHGEIPEEELLKTMEMMTTIDRHFSPRQLKILSERKRELGEEAIESAQMKWPRLIGRMTEEMEKGTDPSAAEVQSLAAEWTGLIQAFTGGDKGIETSLSKMYRAEPAIAAGQGLSKELFDFLGRALKAGGNQDLS